MNHANVGKKILLITAASFIAFTTALAQENTLTAQEKADGWRLLFDGHSLVGWRPYGKPASTAIGPAWRVESGVLKKVAGMKGGDIVSQETFDDFELAWEWRLAKAANNGVKYLVSEQRPQAPGLEYQMIDQLDPKWKSLAPKHWTAALYDLLPPVAEAPVRPAGEWNVSRIVLRGNQVEHWLNQRKVLSYELGSRQVQEAVAASKFKGFPDFAQKIRGPILLTDHQDEAWFRNIKIRELK